MLTADPDDGDAQACTYTPAATGQQRCTDDIWCTYIGAECLATDRDTCLAEASNGKAACLGAGDCSFTDLGAQACVTVEVGGSAVCAHRPSIGLVVGHGGAEITGGITLVDAGLNINAPAES